MTHSFVQVPAVSHYRLQNTRVPLSLLATESSISVETLTEDGLATVDIEIRDGIVASISPAGSVWEIELPAVESQFRISLALLY